LFVQGFTMSTIHHLLAHDPALEAACKAFAMPDRAPASPQEFDCLSRARYERLNVEGVQVVYWTFGKGPRVLLMHGWSSRGSHLMGFVKPLLERGFSVVMFDAPGHGESDGIVSSMIHAAKAAVAIAEHVGDVHSVIGHSAGSTAALWTFNHGLSVNASVHISGPTSLTHVVEGIARAHGLDPTHTQMFSDWAARFMDTPLRSVDLPALSAGLKHPGLIIHDSEDPMIPLSQSHALHAIWPSSALVTTAGLGHRRILSDRHSISSAVEFLTNHA
jgi:pimeloyl-ACP methyl ester carboxylesterase